MELGSLRCDANISVMEKGATKFGTRVEVKNLNSFKAVARAIDYEIGRQIETIEQGGSIDQETRLWDDEAQITRVMRSKEEAMDYRYFHEPDLLQLYIPQSRIDEIQASMPESKAEKLVRFTKDYELPEYDAQVLTEEMELADYFEKVVEVSKNPKSSSNWIMTEVLRHLKETGKEIESFEISAENLGKIICLIDAKTISSKIAKEVFALSLTDSRDPEMIVKEKGLLQVSDEGAIISMVEEVLANSTKMVEDYKNSDEGRRPRVLKGLMGQVMKLSKGKANPELVTKLMLERLEKM